MISVGFWLTVFASGGLAYLSNLMYNKYGWIVAGFFRKRRTGEPPVADGHWFLGSARDFGENPVQFLHETTKKLGHIFTLRLVHEHMTFITDIHSIEAMIRQKNFTWDEIQKQVNHNVFHYFIPDSKRLRVELARMTRGPPMLRMMQTYTSSVRVALDRYEHTPTTGLVTSSSDAGDVRTVRLREFSADTQFCAIYESLFGARDTTFDESRRAFSDFEVFHKYFVYLWAGVPVKLFPKALRALLSLLSLPLGQELMEQDCSEYIRVGIQMMRDHNAPDDFYKAFSLVNLHVNYNSFRVVFWVLNNLVQYPDAMRAVRAEMDELFARKTGAFRRNDSGIAPDLETSSNCGSDSEREDEQDEVDVSIEDLDQLKVLESVIQESMRLSSAVVIVRYVREDTNFEMDDGSHHLVRAGDRVSFYPPATHFDPEIFAKPQDFIYDRFVDQVFHKDGKQIRNPVLPFGMICVGKRVALLEIKWFVLALLARFDLVDIDGQYAIPDTSCYGHEILPPVHDIPVRVSRRKNGINLNFD